MRYATSFVTGLLLAAALSAPAMANSSTQPVLVVIGASYAGAWKPDSIAGYRVINRGKGGEVTDQVRARFASDVIAEKPAAVLIWGHINNIHRAPGGDYAAAAERIKLDYREMVVSARRANIKVIIATEVTLSEAVGFTNRVAAWIGRLRGKTGYAARINAQVQAVNAWLREYARGMDIPVLDIEKLFDDGAGFRRTEYTSDDGSHISDAGYAALTAYAQQQLAHQD